MVIAGTSCGKGNSQKTEKETKVSSQKNTENVYEFQGYVKVSENQKYTSMRSEPDESSDTVTHLRDGDVVDIFEFSGDWFHVKSGSFEGYVQAENIVLEQPVTTSVSTSAAEETTETTAAETVVTETETTVTEAETTTATETTVTEPETSAETTVAETVIVTEIVYVEVPVTQTTEPVTTEPYYYEEPWTEEYTDNSWLPTIDSAYVYALPSESGDGYTYYLNISGNYDYAYVTYVTQGVQTTDTMRFETNDIVLTSGSVFSGIYAYVVPYYNGEIEGETVFCSCETPYMQY